MTSVINIEEQNKRLKIDNNTYNFNISKPLTIRLNTDTNTNRNTNPDKTQYRFLESQTNFFKRKSNKINLNYFISGSNGVILTNPENNNYIYKITFLSDNNIFNGINLLESIYSNYFKINYPNEQNANYFPVQNTTTEIIDYETFLNYYNLDDIALTEFENIKIIQPSDYLIINKMIKHDFNLSQYVKNHKNNKDNLLTFNFERDVNFIFKQILQGLGLLYQEGLVHGDLKTSNIVFNGHQCKLIDFGGVKSTNMNIYSKTCTISTRPPEDIDYEFTNNNNKTPYKSSGIKGECWSVGMILYELITKTNLIDDIYFKICDKFDKDDLNYEDKTIESFVCKLIKKLDNKDFIPNFKKLKRVLTTLEMKYIHLTERLLKINPEERIGDLETIYKEIFDGELKLPTRNDYIKPVLTNYKIKRNFNKYRQIIYPKIINFMTVNKYIRAIEMCLDILDRFFCEKLNKNDNEISIFVNLYNKHEYENILLISSAILVSVSTVYRTCTNIDNFVDKLRESDFKDYLPKFILFDRVIKNILIITNTLKFNIINVKLDYSSNKKMLEEKVNKIVQIKY